MDYLESQENQYRFVRDPEPIASGFDCKSQTL